MKQTLSYILASSKFEN